MLRSIALSIAGSDPSGGAGLQADLKVFQQHQVYGTTVVTLLTVQNTLNVSEVRCLPAGFVIAQLEAVLEDIPPRAAKTGALGNGEIIEAISSRSQKFEFPLVVDPVMISKHGAMLLDKDATYVLRRYLLPTAFLVTPNLAEARELAEMEVRNEKDMEKAAKLISKQGPRHVLVKGGHLEDRAVDLLWSDGSLYRFEQAKISSRNTHGTGCVFSSAITAQLARGLSLIESIQRAKQFITRAIESGPAIGRGVGPVNTFVPV